MHHNNEVVTDFNREINLRHLGSMTNCRSGSNAPQHHDFASHSAKLLRASIGVSCGRGTDDHSGGALKNFEVDGSPSAKESQFLVWLGDRDA